MHVQKISTRRGPIRAILAVGMVIAGTLSVAVYAGVSASPAGATTTSVTYQANVTQPGPLSKYFAQTTGGDGWAVALTSTQVFNVSHHQPTLNIACHNQTDASQCWSAPTKTITSGSFNFATPSAAGLYLDQSTGKLYTYATELPGNTAGVVCIDTTQPASATGAQLFCGFTPLSGAGDAPTTFTTGTYSSVSAPAQVGTNWYSFNEAQSAGAGGGPNGTENTMMCFSLTTFSACPSQPFAVDLSGLTIGAYFATPPTAAIATQVVIPVSGTIGTTATTEMACFNAAAPTTPCTGTWPVSISSLAGAPFPFLNGSGAATGVCLPITGNPCYSLTGALISTPARMPAAIGANQVYNGPAVVNTATDSVYVANEATTAVDCFDYATDKSCTNFPKPISNLVGLYTVTTDPYRNNCLWVNSDHGAGQIQDFDATSGAVCAPGPIRFFATTAVSPSAGCTPTSYTSLQVTSPDRSKFSSGQVQFSNNQGALLPIAAQPLNQFGVANLAGLNFASDPRPQFVVTLNGLTASPAFVSLRLTWTAPYATQCSSGGQTVSTQPGYWLSAADGGIFSYGNVGFFGSTGNIVLNKPIVGIAAVGNKSGYWEVASDGGIFAFGSAGFYGSTGNIHLNKPIVAMAATPTGHGYWLVASDGGIFAFGDAKFYGSAGNIHLNKPIVGMAVTPDGGGYWLVATDGGIFSYGDAGFYGSTGNISLNKPIVGMAAYPQGGGYWMVASDGGIFSYGTSQFYGSTGNITLNKPVVGMATTFDGAGYWLVATDGGIFSYGDAGFAGSAGNLVLTKPIVGMAT